MWLECIARSKREIYSVGEWFKEALFVNSDRTNDAWTCLANLHLDKQEWSPAQKKYELVMKQNRSDPYVNLQIANIFLSTSRLYPDKKLRYLKLAQDYFYSVLSRDTNNIYAANGLAIVFTELGLLDEAKDFFSCKSEKPPLISQTFGSTSVTSTSFKANTKTPFVSTKPVSANFTTDPTQLCSCTSQKLILKTDN